MFTTLYRCAAATGRPSAMRTALLHNHGSLKPTLVICPLASSRGLNVTATESSRMKRKMLTVAEVRGGPWGIKGSHTVPCLGYPKRKITYVKSLADSSGFQAKEIKILIERARPFPSRL